MKAWKVTAHNMSARYYVGIFYAETKQEAERMAKEKTELSIAVLPGEFNYSAVELKHEQDYG